MDEILIKNMKFNNLISLVPSAEELKIDWNRIMQSELHAYFQRMSETEQNPEWHGEGNVWVHTQMVCESLVELTAWRELEKQRREELFIAALLHDIGKTVCTRVEDGLIISPNHTSIGERMTRTVLWKDFGLCGTYEAQQFREAVCSLIRYHSIPFHFYTEKTPERTAIMLASKGELVSDFSNEMLSMLVEADIKGRISNDTAERLEHIYFFNEIAKEVECLKNPKVFPSPFSRYSYLSGRNILPGQELYDDTWGKVFMLSGLPGTGKDTYIETHYSDLPTVSLDVLRKDMKISPKEPQGVVVDAARKQAREYLRKKQPFVWNATNLTPTLREKQIDLFMGYKASLKIAYLETGWDEMLRRNQSRLDAVPEIVIEGMLGKLTLPNLREAHEIEWVLV